MHDAKSMSARGGGRNDEALILGERGRVGRWDRVSLIFALQVEEVFAPSRWRRLWRRFLALRFEEVFAAARCRRPWSRFVALIFFQGRGK